MKILWKAGFKFLFLFLFLVLGSKAAFAQDTIVQINGNKMLAVVQEVGSTEIKYKKYENRQTSPVYTINRKAVKMIKYADGTKDEFIDGTNVKDLPPPVRHGEPEEPFKNGLNKPVIRTKYVYFGFRASLSNNYSGGNFKSYWTNLFSSEQDGAGELNTGYPSFYEFLVGNSFPMAGKDHLNIEVQIVSSVQHALDNTAVFLDGSNGGMHFELFGVNLAAQYMHSIDPLENFQSGGEFGLDYGMTTGSEVDVFGTSGPNSIYLD